jgi:hypothetical protein
MSTIANWSYTQQLTIWRKGAKDIYGEFGYSEAEIVYCSYRVGGSESYPDSTGLAFMPKTIYWTELKLVSGGFAVSPNFGDKIALGSYTGTLPSDDSEDIRSITIDDAAMFGASEMPDYILGV